MRGDRERTLSTLPLLFLGGLGRSGSTLVERLLSELPGTCSLGEVVHLWERALRDDERCGCGAAFSACPFWSEIGEGAFGGWSTLDPQEVLALKRRVDRTRFVPRLASPRLPARTRVDLLAYLDLYERVYAAAKEVSGARVVIDSSKHASLAYCLRWSDRLDLRVLHMVRDSPAVAHSWGKQVVRPEADNSLMPQYGPLRVGAGWVADNAMFDLLRLLGTPVRLLRYEDAVADPARALLQVARHAGLTVAAKDLDFIHGDRVTVRPSHTVAGNPMRFRSGDIVVRRDDAWRDQLPAGRRRAVIALTQPVRLRFGYVGRLDKSARTTSSVGS